MISIKLPKEVLSLFPMWEYRCQCCSTYVESNKSFCPNCKTPFDEKRWRVPPRFLKSHETMSEYAHKVLAPKLTPEQRELLFHYFTELFRHGFEGGDFGEDPETGYSWTGTNGTPQVLDTDSHHGTYSAFFNAQNEYCYKDISEQSTFYSRIYLKIVQDVASGYAAPFMWHTASGTGMCYALRFATSGLYLRYRDGASLVYSSVYSVDIDDGEWHCLELKTVVAASGEYRLYLDDSEILAVTGKDTDNYGNVNRLTVGKAWDYGSPSAEWYIDCVVVADTYIGPETTEQTYTKTWTTDALFKKLGIPKTLSVDTAFQKQDIPKTFGLDATFQKSFIIQKQIDALFKRFDILKSFAVDARFGALMTQTISRQIDILLKKLDLTKNFGLDVYFGSVEAETYAKTFALDAIFAYKVRLPELWLDENGKIVLNISKPYTWVGS